MNKTSLVQRFLSDPQIGWVWVVPRVWLGAQWTQAAQQKIIDPKWGQTGEAFEEVWLNALQTSVGGRLSNIFEGYRAFLQMMVDTQAYTWFAKLVAYGELFIGMALMIGAFTGLMALFGSLIHWSFVVSGIASTSPILFVMAIALIIAWKVSGYCGADYYLLRGRLTWQSEAVKAETQKIDAEVVMAWAEEAGQGDQ